MIEPQENRIRTVIRAVGQWKSDLRTNIVRSPLRRYQERKTSTLNLTPGLLDGLDTKVLNRLLDEKTVSLRALFPDDSGDATPSTVFIEARRRLTAIRKTALANLEEKGIETLFASIGLATWTVDSGSPWNAPVILLPLAVEATGAAATDFKIRVTGDAHFNPVLADALRSEYSLETDNEESDLAETPPSSLSKCEALLDRLRETWRVVPKLEIELHIAISNFSYATMPLVTDLEQNGEEFAKNDIVAAIAGDKEAREALASNIRDPAPHQPDIDPPAEEFLVLDADSSQHLAINRVLAGESLVIQGPPGTGKSQTIANLITTLIARGKRVLFVAEKRAAIEAVTKRLNQVGLSNLVMDLHGGVSSRRDFARSLADSLSSVSAIPARDYSDLHRRLQQRRSALVANSRAINEPRDPWNLSVFEMWCRILEIPKAARNQLELSRTVALHIGSGEIEQLKEEIEEWVGLDGYKLVADHPEWSRSTVSTAEGAQRAFEQVRQLTEDFLPSARDALFAALDENQTRKLQTIAQWEQTGRFLVLQSRSWWSRIRAAVFSEEYRKAKREFGSPDSLSLTTEAVQNLEKLIDSLVAGLDALSDETGLADFDKMPHENLSAVLGRMVSDRRTAINLPRIRELEARLEEVGIGDLVTRVGKHIAPHHASLAVEDAWLRAILDGLEFKERLVSAFDRDSHSRHRDEFDQTDRQHRDSTADRIIRLTAESIIETMNQFTEEALLIRQEAAKKRRHLTVRQLLRRAPNVLTALRPCWTMSPILVAEMIPADRQLFDVVIFDEASQIPPAEAIGSLARAPQAVIAGDSRQLPPTAFFSRSVGDDGEDEEEEGFSLTSDIESLLDIARALLRDTMLEWHYRSRDDRLIAFSNNHIYGGSLTAFPGAITGKPVELQLIPFRPIVGERGTRSNPDEVEKVVDLVLRHARNSPNQTLGVIAFGQHHADNIENSLARRLSENSDISLDEFFSDKNDERFFVKNIERVQGDERDVIILSVGYHKDVNGNLPYRFGPILSEGGERRLNVAVTRARSHLIVVSSFSHHDMDPSRSIAKGVQLLRQYLEFASSGGENLGGDIIDVPLNAFELDVKDGLEQRGIPVTPQYGVSRYRIDFAAAHPKEPGRMVLAIEADGASYHSVPTARDRDRLRQQVLESKGWRFHRIWSTSWFRDREAELDKLEEAYYRAVDASESSEPTPVSGRTSVVPPIDNSPQRGPRPSIPRKGTRGIQSITDYSQCQLVELANWILADTLLRTDDALLREMMSELGFGRSGKRIGIILSAAIRVARNSSHT